MGGSDHSCFFNAVATLRVRSIGKSEFRFSKSKSNSLSFDKCCLIIALCEDIS